MNNIKRQLNKHINKQNKWEKKQKHIIKEIDLNYVLKGFNKW